MRSNPIIKSRWFICRQLVIHPSCIDIKRPRRNLKIFLDNRDTSFTVSRLALFITGIIENGVFLWSIQSIFGTKSTLRSIQLYLSCKFRLLMGRFCRELSDSLSRESLQVFSKSHLPWYSLSRRSKVQNWFLKKIWKNSARSSEPIRLNIFSDIDWTIEFLNTNYIYLHHQQQPFLVASFLV